MDKLFLIFVKLNYYMVKIVFMNVVLVMYVLVLVWVCVIMGNGNRVFFIVKVSFFRDLDIYLLGFRELY